MRDLDAGPLESGLRQLLEGYAADQLAELPTETRFAPRIRARMVSKLPLRSLTADAVAARFSVSSRTLRRRLREEGASYRQLLDDARAELARRYLAGERRTIDEVAFSLGFSDPSAFGNAFRRWTGRTPALFARTDST